MEKRYSKLHKEFDNLILKSIEKNKLKVIEESNKIWFFINAYLGFCISKSDNSFDLTKLNIVGTSKQVFDYTDLQEIKPTDKEIKKKIFHADVNKYITVNMCLLTSNNLNIWANKKIINIFGKENYSFHTQKENSHIFCKNYITDEVEGVFLPIKL